VIAFQTAWKLFNAKWNVAGQDRYPRILFLADRNVLRDHPFTQVPEFAYFLRSCSETIKKYIESQKDQGFKITAPTEP